MSHAPLDPLLDPAVQAALHRHGSAGDDELCIGGIAVRELAARFGTPFYAYDAGILRARARGVQSALGGDVGLLYSIKANPSLALTVLLRELGIGAEIASRGELELALAAGHAGTELRFAGPGKTDAEIAAAIARGPCVFHAESPSEVDAIERAATAAAQPVPVAVRVHFGRELAGARLRMAGGASRFGLDHHEVPALLRRIAATPRLQLRGLHVYGGTQCFDAGAFGSQAAELADAAERWERELSLPLLDLDLGGGFGVPTYLGDPDFDLAAAGTLVRAMLTRHDRPGRRWLVELGRWLVAPAGVYVARVVRRKHSAGIPQLALDGGLHHCAFATGAGTVLRRPPLLVHATALQQPDRQAVALGGPLCTPQDQFADALLLPPCQEGDLLAVLHAGAYGQSYSPTTFLSHPTAVELLVADGKARIVRVRGEPADTLRGQSP